MLDTTSGAMDESLEKENWIQTQNIGTRTIGIMLIILASAFSACTAVLNRSLKEIDYVVVMTYHGLFGFIASIVLLTGKFFFINDPVETIQTLHLQPIDCLMIAFGATVDAASVFGQTVAFQSSPAGFVSLISFVNVVYALLADSFIFEEKISVVEIGAASVICLITIVVAAYKMYIDKPATLSYT